MVVVAKKNRAAANRVQPTELVETWGQQTKSMRRAMGQCEDVGC
jgi:hypothetical protein